MSLVYYGFLPLLVIKCDVSIHLKYTINPPVGKTHDQLHPEKETVEWKTQIIFRFLKGAVLMSNSSKTVLFGALGTKRIFFWKHSVIEHVYL